MKAVLAVNETNFESEVLRSNQAIIAGFWAAGCDSSKKLVPLLEEIAREQTGRVKIVTVNVGENPNLAAYYHIQSTPTLLYFYNGLIQDQTLGNADKQVIVSRLAAMPGTVPR
jgi:thioredoxin 1